MMTTCILTPPGPIAQLWENCFRDVAQVERKAKWGMLFGISRKFCIMKRKSCWKLRNFSILLRVRLLSRIRRGEIKMMFEWRRRKAKMRKNIFSIFSTNFFLSLSTIFFPVFYLFKHYWGEINKRRKVAKWNFWKKNAWSRLGC